MLRQINMPNKTRIREVDRETGHVCLRDGVTVAVFLPTPLHEIVDLLLAACEEYFKIIPKDVMRWALVGANSEEWKPTNSTTLRSCRAQLSANAAKKRSLTFFALAGCEMAGDAPSHGVVVIGNPRDPEVPDELSLMQMYFPAEVVENEHVEKFVENLCKVATLLPFVSGYASPALQWAGIGSGDAAVRSKKIMLRYPGYDVQMNEEGRTWLGSRVRGARWLTFLGPDITEKLGGVNSLRASVREPIKIEPIGHGVMIRAGKVPEIGDRAAKVGTPHLRSVAKMLEPVTVFDEIVLLREFDHDKQFLEKWERRFLD
jgi:hypothetical protein